MHVYQHGYESWPSAPITISVYICNVDNGGYFTQKLQFKTGFHPLTS